MKLTCLQVNHVDDLHVDEVRVPVHQHGHDVLMAPVSGPVEQSQPLRVPHPGVGVRQRP